MSKGADLERRFGRNLYESLGARRKDDGQGPGQGNGPGGAASDPTATPAATATATATATAGEFGFEPVNGAAASPADGRTRLREAGVMELSRIIPDPDQPRKHFHHDAISRLAASLKTHGQLQPIRVRWNESLGKWLIIAGERRYRASLEAGLATIQCIFVEKEEDSSLWLAEQMVENCLREDLTPIEQAIAFDRLMKTQGWSARRLAEELHVSPGSVSKALALLNLPEDLRQAVDAGAISSTAGYELARISDPLQRQEIADRLLKKEIKRDDLAEFNRDTIGQNSQPAIAAEQGGAPQMPTPMPMPTPSLTKAQARAAAKADLEARDAKARAAVEADVLATLSHKTEPMFLKTVKAKGPKDPQDASADGNADANANANANGTATDKAKARGPETVRHYVMRSGAQIFVQIPKSHASDVEFYDALLYLVSGLKALGTGTPKGKYVAETVISEIIPITPD